MCSNPARKGPATALPDAPATGRLPRGRHRNARRGLRRRARGLALRAVAVMPVMALASYVAIAAPTEQPAAGAPSPPAAHAATAAPAGTASAGVAPAQPVRTPVMGISAATTGDLDRFIAATGTSPEVFDTFEAWSLGRPLQRGIADTVAARGARLSITWEPWDSTGPRTEQPEYSLSSIIEGAHDAYIDMFAESVKQYPHPVTIRLMHEMNGNWYPWGADVNGNRPGEYVLAWRHVHDRFAALGVTNVTWMWAPNGIYRGSAPLIDLYPGDAHVDLVGISNYNWGDRSATRWRDAESLFAPTIDALQVLTTRPIWIAETGSSNSGGSKAQWLADTFAGLQHRPEIAGVIWFDQVDEARGVDWRIHTESAATAAWQHAFRSRPHTATSTTTPVSTPTREVAE